eukprot:jgi/Mesen1/1784/ME000014S01187
MRFGKEEISFEEVADAFTLPIVSASERLGVCTATLKRVCKENGIPRWPYRKIMAGRTVEEIRAEAAAQMKIDQASSAPAAAPPGGTPHAQMQRSASYRPSYSAAQSHGSYQPRYRPSSPASQGGAIPQQRPQGLNSTMMSPFRGLQPLNPPLYPYPYPLPPVPSRRNTIEQRKALASYLQSFSLGFPASLEVEEQRWWGGQASPPSPSGEPGGGSKAEVLAQTGGDLRGGLGGQDSLTNESGQYAGAERGVGDNGASERGEGADGDGSRDGLKGVKRKRQEEGADGGEPSDLRTSQQKVPGLLIESTTERGASGDADSLKSAELGTTSAAPAAGGAGPCQVEPASLGAGEPLASGQSQDLASDQKLGEDDPSVRETKRQRISEGDGCSEVKPSAFPSSAGGRGGGQGDSVEGESRAHGGGELVTDENLDHGSDVNAEGSGRVRRDDGGIQAGIREEGEGEGRGGRSGKDGEAVDDEVHNVVKFAVVAPGLGPQGDVRLRTAVKELPLSEYSMLKKGLSPAAALSEAYERIASRGRHVVQSIPESAGYDDENVDGVRSGVIGSRSALMLRFIFGQYTPQEWTS